MAKRRASKTRSSPAKAKKRKKPKKTVTAKRAKARKPQRFTVSHHREEDFDQGLRPYSAYRDLGMAPATGGMVQAHVIRMTKPFSAEEVAIPHFHDVDFQMVYVLKGWIKGEYEGAGVVTMREGSCWLQPPRIKHAVLDYSDDCELLEIIMPADFDTVELE